MQTFLVDHPSFHNRSKHIEISVHIVREKVASKSVQARHLSSKPKFLMLSPKFWLGSIQLRQKQVEHGDHTVRLQLNVEIKDMTQPKETESMPKKGNIEDVGNLNMHQY